MKPFTEYLAESKKAYNFKVKVAGELPEESVPFRFIRAACLVNLKGSVGLMLTKVSVMRVTIPLDLSTQAFCYHVLFTLVSQRLF